VPAREYRLAPTVTDVRVLAGFYQDGAEPGREMFAFPSSVNGG
jgi:hypothetical protein